jgi:outer membrane receptor protein involved in Fe transport
MKSKLLLIAFLILNVIPALSQNGTITGKVTDKETGEEIVGAAVIIAGTMTGSATDFLGDYRITGVEPGTYTLRCQFISYEPLEKANITIKAGEGNVINFELSSAELRLDEVKVVAKSNRESEVVLLLDQKNSLVATQSVGVQELSRKGVSDAEGAVTKVSGISKQEGVKNVFVRGLGDRYNATMLNGFPLPSEDPEYKNIALGFFGTDVIQSIDVNKVFRGSNSSDVGGAVININSRQLTGDSAFGIDISGGMNSEANGVDFLRTDGSGYFGFANSDHPSAGSYNFRNGLDPLPLSQPLNHSYAVSGGKSYRVGDGSNPLSFFVVGSHSTDYSFTEESVRSITTGDVEPYQDQTGNRYSQNISQLVLANVNLGLNQAHSVEYNFMALHANSQYYGEYSGRHAEKHQDSETYEGYYRRQQINDNLLLTHQLLSEWRLSETLQLSAGVSYNSIKGEEPDRRENYLSKRGEDSYIFTGSDRQKRFFSELNESDFNAKTALTFKLNDKFASGNSSIVAGYDGRFLNDEFKATEFNFSAYPGLHSLNDLKLDDVYNQVNYSSGEFRMTEGVPNSYDVTKLINSGYIDGSYQLASKLTGNAGIRVDIVDIKVGYDVDHTAPGKVPLEKFYLLPSLNLKYDINDKNSLRFGASKTYTLPQSKEISPYRYVNIGFASQGNADLKPSDNYNGDLKWDFYISPSELLSLTGFYKYVADPIARVEAGNSAGVLKYDNISDFANIAGVELEVRKNIINNVNTATSKISRLSMGLNASYIYTGLRVEVPGTPSKDVQLEGAAPFIGNFDISYNLSDNDRNLLASLVFNHISDRVHTIGMLGFKDIVEESVSVVDFVSSYKFNKRFTLKLKASNLLDPSYRLTRERSNSTEKVTLNEFKKGVNFSVGLSFEL